LNRGKESICLDIKDPGDKELLLGILKTADVFVQNLAPGATERAGLGAAALREVNERLITVDISGYGIDGPYRDAKAYDLLVQCESGLASVTGSPEEPGRVGVSICDIACGMSAHAAILEALIERGQTGVGKSLHVSLFDSVADWLTVPLLHQEYTGKTPPRVGISHASIAPYGAYECSDGSQLAIAVQNSREWRIFCTVVLQNSGMAADSLYESNVARCRNRASLDAEIKACFSNLSRDEVVSRLETGGIAFASINDLAGLSQHPQLRRCSVASPSGSVNLVAPPVSGSGNEIKLRPVPGLGEHGAAIRDEFRQ
jgi:itaconate CoA-transferase